MKHPPAVAEASFHRWIEAPGPAIVRSWQPGDRIRLPGGTKSLQDLFTDRKVPREQRPRVPVVEADGQVVCVGDLVLAAGFSARKLT